jgi:hypothetical protein
MKVLILKFTDEEYARLEEEARREGYALLSDYVKSRIFYPPNFQPQQSQISNVDDIIKKIERKVQDMVNPFTAEVEDLKRKIAEISEKLENIESKPVESESRPRKESFYKSGYKNEQNEQKEKKTAMDYLRDQGAIYESETKLKNPDLFFDKLEKQGAKVLYTEKERIGVDPKFFEEFSKKISNIHTVDEVEAQKFLNRNEYKLFQKLRSTGTVYFDNATKSWKVLVN